MLTYQKWVSTYTSCIGVTRQFFKGAEEPVGIQHLMEKVVFLGFSIFCMTVEFLGGKRDKTFVGEDNLRGLLSVHLRRTVCTYRI